MLCRFPMRNGYRRERDEIHSWRPRGGRPPRRRCGLAARRRGVLLEWLWLALLAPAPLRVLAPPASLLVAILRRPSTQGRRRAATSDLDAAPAGRDICAMSGSSRFLVTTTTTRGRGVSGGRAR